MFATLASLVVRAAPAVAAVTGVVAAGAFNGCTGVAHADALSPKEWRKFRLESRRQVSPDTAEYRFSFPRKRICDRLGLEPASLLMARAEVDGEMVQRPYTPTSPENAIGSTTLVVKSYANGKLSKAIGNLQPGDTIEFKGPFQKFEYKPNMKKYIGMIAGGTGITPMLQLIEKILSNPRDNTEVRLVFANKTPQDVLLKDRLDALAWKHANFKVLYTVDKGDDDWDGESGYVSTSMIRSVLPPPVEDSLILVCGPPGMVKHVAGEGPGPSNKFQQGELKGLLAHMGYTKSMVFKY